MALFPPGKTAAASVTSLAEWRAPVMTIVSTVLRSSRPRMMYYSCECIRARAHKYAWPRARVLLLTAAATMIINDETRRRFLSRRSLSWVHLAPPLAFHVHDRACNLVSGLPGFSRRESTTAIELQLAICDPPRDEYRGSADTFAVWANSSFH